MGLFGDLLLSLVVELLFPFFSKTVGSIFRTFSGDVRGHPYIVNGKNWFIHLAGAGVIWLLILNAETLIGPRPDSGYFSEEVCSQIDSVGLASRILRAWMLIGITGGLFQVLAILWTFRRIHPLTLIMIPLYWGLLFGLLRYGMEYFQAIDTSGWTDCLLKTSPPLHQLGDTLFFILMVSGVCLGIPWLVLGMFSVWFMVRLWNNEHRLSRLSQEAMGQSQDEQRSRAPNNDVIQKL